MIDQCHNPPNRKVRDTNLSAQNDYVLVWRIASVAALHYLDQIQSLALTKAFESFAELKAFFFPGRQHLVARSMKRSNCGKLCEELNHGPQAEYLAAEIAQVLALALIYRPVLNLFEVFMRSQFKFFIIVLLIYNMIDSDTLLFPSQLEPKADSLTIEEGGSGPHAAVAIEDSGLPGITIFRPKDLAALGVDQKLPVLLWGNGACANSAEEHKNFLNEIASHGYLVLAIGPLSQLQERGPIARERTKSEQLIQSLNWIEAAVKLPTSQYFDKVDVSKVAAMGMSCGGLQAIAISADPRIDTTVVCNSGVLPAPSPMAAMPSLTKEVLKDFHGPVIYIMGGPSDIAYKNAMDDFSRVDHVPIVMTNLDVGHGGTYRQPRGGEFTRVALGWLDWQLKSRAEKAKMFIGEDSELKRDAKWTIEVKNFE